MQEAYYNRYNTELGPEERKGLYEYLMNMSMSEGRNRFNDINDYDMAGAYKEGLGEKSDKGFFYDLFKKPNHPVFSDDSRYNGVDGHFGGHWTDGTDEYPGGTFTPSAWNLQNMPAPEMREYFNRFEPEAKLILPEENNNGGADRDMAVKYVNNSGGGLWDKILGTVGTLVGGPLGGAAGSFAGNLANGNDVGSSLVNAGTGYVGEIFKNGIQNAGIPNSMDDSAWKLSNWTGEGLKDYSSPLTTEDYWFKKNNNWRS